jgi:RHH-type transcriptional regulator, rel operon repressor / antitoxin RelB
MMKATCRHDLRRPGGLKLWPKEQVSERIKRLALEKRVSSRYGGRRLLSLSTAITATRSTPSRRITIVARSRNHTQRTVVAKNFGDALRGRRRFTASALATWTVSANLTPSEVLSLAALSAMPISRSKKRLERLARSTGRSRSFLAAEAISECLNVNEWQVADIKRAIACLDRGEGASNAVVKDWVDSWGSNDEKPTPTRS